MDENNTTVAVQVAAAIARRFEGCYLRPYLCPAGVPTIGYGATYYENGETVRMTDPPINKEYAEKLLIWMVKTKYLPAVLKYCPNVSDPIKLAGLIDFAFNLGAGNLKNSNLRRVVNAGNWDQVPAEYRKWVRGGGRILKGLVIRREADINPSAFI